MVLSKINKNRKQKQKQKKENQENELSSENLKKIVGTNIKNIYT